MKSVTIYQRKDSLYFHPSSLTEAGIWIATPPFHVLKSHASPLQKGELLRQMLNKSREGVEGPEGWEDLLKPLYKLAGVKTWGTFAKIAKCCLVESEGDEIRFIPQRNLGPREGFTANKNQVIKVSNSLSDEEIGTMVETVMTKCE